MSKVAITSGKFRGRQLAAPDTSATHPMGSREKLALFNALISAGAVFSDETRVLDIYAGSGALGLEAASRGAGRLVFVENHPKALAAIRENLRALGLSDAIVSKSINELTKSHGLSDTPKSNSPLSDSLSNSSDSNLQFDLILADPPYDHFPDDLSFLSDYLKAGGLLALSHPASVDPADLFTSSRFASSTAPLDLFNSTPVGSGDRRSGLILLSTKSHAASRISIFRKR